MHEILAPNHVIISYTLILSDLLHLPSIVLHTIAKVKKSRKDYKITSI